MGGDIHFSAPKGCHLSELLSFRYEGLRLSVHIGLSCGDGERPATGCSRDGCTMTDLTALLALHVIIPPCDISFHSLQAASSPALHSTALQQTHIRTTTRPLPITLMNRSYPAGLTLGHWSYSGPQSLET